MNYGPLNSNVADIVRDNARAAGNVFIRPKQIDLYGSDLLQAAEIVEVSYEHTDELGIVAPLPLTQAQIADVIWKRLALYCESYLSDIEDHVRSDAELKRMLDEAATK